MIPLSEVKDRAFSQNILGEGVAIYPEQGQVVAPADGVLTTLFPTHHALGITTGDGVEILIHIGMDTVRLEGQSFYPKVDQGAQVRKGEVLLEFDLKAIETAGFSLVTPVIITNTKAYIDIVETNEETVDFGDTLMSVIH